MLSLDVGPEAHQKRTTAVRVSNRRRGFRPLGEREVRSLLRTLTGRVVGAVLFLAGVATVAANWDELLRLAARLGTWMSASVGAMVSALGTSYAWPLWALILVSLLALVGLCAVTVVALAFVPTGQKEREVKARKATYSNYVEDMIDNARWRWSWSNGDIEHLWCFCPRCDAELIPSRGFETTYFVCERCDHQEPTAVVRGTDVDQSLLRVQAEIRRRIRTGEYRRAPDAAA